MSVILKLYKTVGSTVYSLSPMPAVVIQNTYRHRGDSTNLVAREITWNVTGLFLPNGNSILEQVNALKAFFNDTTDAGKIVEAKIKDGSDVLEDLTNEGQGIRVSNLSFDEGSGPEWATRRSYSFTLTGTEFTASVNTLGDCTYGITYSTEQNGLITRTVSGILKDVLDANAVVKYTTFKAAQSWATWAGANLISDTYSVDVDGIVVDFTIVHKKYFILFQGGITNSDVSKSVITDEMNVTRLVYSGWFEGSGIDCATAITTLDRTGFHTLSSSTSRNDYINRTTFTIEGISTGADILFQSERLAVTYQLTEFVHKRVLGGGSPVKQTTSKNIVRASQSGIIKRKSSYPSSPSLNWASGDLVGKVETRLTPEIQVGSGNYVYGLQYSYEFEFAADCGWT